MPCFSLYLSVFRNDAVKSSCITLCIMKKLFFLFFGLLLWFTGSSQSCLPQGITFSTQAQIDDFHTNYPNCTQIEGDVTIRGADITNLNGLNGLKSIGGSLNICYDSVLTNLSGLGSLISIGNNLYLAYNPVMTDLTGLNAVSHIGGALQIYWNHALSSVTGLNNIITIGGFLDFIGNDTLTDITALASLKSINGYLRVGWNNSLKSLSGLGSIDYETITYLDIYYNDSLSDCSVNTICYFILTARGVQIYSNTTGCNSKQEVSDNCPYDVTVESITNDNVFSIYPNPASDKITLETSATPTQNQLSIMNLCGQEVLTCQITQPKMQLDISTLPSGVYFVRLTNDRITEVGKFVKQ